jgi:hypothetical protein
MNGYEGGKIYRLVCNGLVYYGSTKQSLKDRIRAHRAHYNQHLNGKGHYYASFEILKLGDCKIELVEDYPCSSKKELELREKYYITSFECVNKSIPRRTTKEYLEANKEKIKEKNRLRGIKYREGNEELVKRKKQFYDEHKADILKQKKEYYEANKELIKQKAKAYREAKKVKDI